MPIVGILRGISPEALEAIIPAYQEAGLTTLEITMNTEGFTGMMTAAVAEYGSRLNIGAGTVCSEEDLDRALAAGAQFIVTPILNETVVKKCVDQGIPVFPGALTPSEIYQAWTWGATMVKVFPASAFGPSYIREVLAPLNELRLLPTGGVSLENMADYYRAGAGGFGLGSLLFDKKLIEAKQWPALQHKMQAVADHCRQIRPLKDR